MPSRWTFLCCTCDKDDRYEYQKPYARVTGKSRVKKPPGQKFTWTRKSLLKNEQSEYQETPFDQIGYHVKPEGQQEPVNHENDEIELKSFEDTKYKRRTAREVFEKAPGRRPRTTNTTFPWMNEEFVPNGRSVTRLGISSVQINAKRNEQANRNASGKNINVTSGNNVPRKFYSKSQSFNDGQNRDNVVYGKSMIRTNVSQSNVKTVPNGYQNNARIVPNGHGFRGNVTSVVNKGSTVAVPAGVGRTERPMILHAPSSNVGVRVLGNNVRNKGTRVPKLGDYLLLKPDTQIPINQEHGSNVRHGDHSIMPFSYKPLASETQSDVSFSSEITFRKSNVGSETTDVSLKRSKQPTIFSSNVNKYERLKSRADVKLPYNPNDVKDPMTNVESMYGYVPKAVQNVRASNALSGGQIDDFFMQRMDDRELEKFASIDRKEQGDWRDVMETNYLGDKVMSGRPKSVPSYVNTDHNHVRPSSGVETGNRGCQNDYANVRVGLQQIKLAPPPNMRDTKGNGAKSTNARQSNINNYVNVEKRGDGMVKDENENKVIMIDFPPNLDNDKGHNHVQVNTHNGRSDASDVKKDRGTEQLMVNPLTENEEVLY